MKLIIIITALLCSTFSDISAIDKKPAKQQKKTETKIANQENIYAEKKAGKTLKNYSAKEKYQKNISSLWDVQFAYDVTIGSGIETDGNYFYVSQWNIDSIYKFSLTGEPAGSFSISAVSGIFVIAYYGICFYCSVAFN